MKIKGKLIIFKSKELTEAPKFGLSKETITGISYKGILFTTASNCGYIEFVGESSSDIFIKANKYMADLIGNKLNDAVDGTIEVEDIWYDCLSDKKERLDW